MALYFHVFCSKLTHRRIVCRGMHQFDLSFVLLANRHSMLSGTQKLDLYFVFLPVKVYILRKYAITCANEYLPDDYLELVKFD